MEHRLGRTLRVFLVALAGLQGIAWLMDRLAKTERTFTVRRIAVSNA